MLGHYAAGVQLSHWSLYFLKFRLWLVLVLVFVIVLVFVSRDWSGKLATGSRSPRPQVPVIRTGYTMYKETDVLVLVLVVDEHDSFSSVDAHIFPELVQMILQRINCRCIVDMLWQVV